MGPESDSDDKKYSGNSKSMALGAQTTYFPDSGNDDDKVGEFKPTEVGIGSFCFEPLSNSNINYSTRINNTY